MKSANRKPGSGGREPPQVPAARRKAKSPAQGAAKAASPVRRAASERRGYGGRSAAELHAERRARLLDAGLELFAQRGYARTSIETLCSAARVTTRHFYELFPSREALLVALYEQIVGEARQAVLAAFLAPEPDPKQRIHKGLNAFIRSYVEDARRARIGVLEAVGISPALEQRRREVIHEFAQIIRSYADSLVAAGLLPKRDFHLLSVALVGGINELLAEWLTVAEPPSIRVLTDEIALMLQALILGGQQLKPP